MQRDTEAPKEFGLVENRSLNAQQNDLQQKDLTVDTSQQGHRRVKVTRTSRKKIRKSTTGTSTVPEELVEKPSVAETRTCERSK